MFRHRFEVQGSESGLALTNTAQLGLHPHDLGHGTKDEHMASRVNDTYSDIIIILV